MWEIFLKDRVEINFVPKSTTRVLMCLVMGSYNSRGDVDVTD